MSEKLTAQQIEYYKKPAKGLAMSSKDMQAVDVDRFDEIQQQAQSDVENKKKLADKSAFNNDSEYKFYLLSAYDTASAIEHGY